MLFTVLSFCSLVVRECKLQSFPKILSHPCRDDNEIKEEWASFCETLYLLTATLSSYLGVTHCKLAENVKVAVNIEFNGSKTC